MLHAKVAVLVQELSSGEDRGHIRHLTVSHPAHLGAVRLLPHVRATWTQPLDRRHRADPPAGRPLTCARSGLPVLTVN
jgi:hypothetical protein